MTYEQLEKLLPIFVTVVGHTIITLAQNARIIEVGIGSTPQDAFGASLLTIIPYNTDSVSLIDGIIDHHLMQDIEESALLKLNFSVIKELQRYSNSIMSVANAKNPNTQTAFSMSEFMS